MKIKKNNNAIKKIIKTELIADRKNANNNAVIINCLVLYAVFKKFIVQFYIIYFKSICLPFD